MFRLSRLVWRDAASRYWVGVVLACMPAVYLWREWPPWVVRETLWQAGPLPLLGIAVAYVLLTLGPTRQMVASERLSLWRQCPISPNRWRVFHGVHLMLLHAPAVVALGYGLMPAGPGIAIGGPAVLAAASLGPLTWRLGHPMTEARTWALRLPRPRIPAGAWARVLGLALARRRPAATSTLLIANVALAWLGWVATSHVLAAGEPPHPAAYGFVAASTSLGALAVWAAWPLVRREQWWLDSLCDDATVPVVASMLVTGAVTLPGLGVALASLARLGPSSVVHGLVGWAAVSAWSGAISYALDADAVRRRDASERRAGRFVLALLLPVPLSTWFPASMLLPAVVAWVVASRRSTQARQARRRFELGDIEDDHG